MQAHGALLLACRVWGRFHSGFPGDLSPQEWAEVDVSDVTTLFLSSQRRCPMGSHLQSGLPPRWTRGTTGDLCRCRHLSSRCLKSEGTTSMLHVQGEKLVLVVPSSPLSFAHMAGNFRCLHSGPDTVFFHRFAELFNMSLMSLAARFQRNEW